MAEQLERVGEMVGRQGKTRHRVRFGLSDGAWGEMESSVNTLIDDLIWPTREVTRAVAAVAQGDLLQTVRLDVDGRPLQGEFLQAAGGFIPQFGVNNWNAVTGVGLGGVIGLLAALIPATMASRLKIVDALRRVA